MDSWSTFQHPAVNRGRDGEVKDPRTDGCALKGVGQPGRQIRREIPNLIVPRTHGRADSGRNPAPEKNF